MQKKEEQKFTPNFGVTGCQVCLFNLHIYHTAVPTFVPMLWLVISF